MAEEIATIAGGCFWCTEAVFDDVIGISEVESGYIGGHVADPNYRQVCDGNTGHAEAIRIHFDPQVIGYADLLDIFFHIHDPTQLNRQGADVGSQYRSAMFFTDDAQQTLFEEARDRAAETWDGDVVTTISPLGDFYRAEEYHQDFFAKNPGQGYCMAVALPKVTKIRKSYAPYVLSS